MAARDFKGVGNQYFQEGKVIVEGADVYNGDETGDVAPTVTAATGGSYTSGPKVCCWNGDTTPKAKEDVSLTLRAQQGGEGIGVAAVNLIVRRITPMECERLQGLTDNFTQYREELELEDNRWIKTGKVVEVKDGPRYRMLGNGITAHVLEWIARRISLVLKM